MKGTIKLQLLDEGNSLLDETSFEVSDEAVLPGKAYIATQILAKLIPLMDHYTLKTPYEFLEQELHDTMEDTLREAPFDIDSPSEVASYIDAHQEAILLCILRHMA